ncbi:MAG: hypothetical protein HRF43_11290 [Phycisphaerae bacterium]|jgi:hypothetical protein
MFIVFVTTLAAGLLGILSLCRMQQVTWKFVRLIGLLALCLLVPVLAGFMAWGGWRRGTVAIGSGTLTAGAALSAFIVLGLAPLSKQYRTTVRVFAGFGALLALPAAWMWGVHYGLWPAREGHGQAGPVADPSPAGGLDVRWAACGAQVLMAWALGSVSLATALGHAYLTHTAMTIRPLRRLARLFAAAMTARFAWAVLVGGGLAWRAIHDGRLAAADLRGAWLLLGVRGLIGLVIPGAFAFMVLETVRLRATQSATGILYFALVLVFIGELTALHLLRELGVAF